ncbi:MAG TPA: LysE family transporter [Rhabdochlamydiaceae bacterium]|jgi:RhtB (resistance to homoserine/threonine) family protein|nr:LysE family transporter [Rhabdochlamydiaceae bacterium]
MEVFEYLTLGLIVLLGAMSPGPDFVMVTKNSLAGSRQLGILTGLGVACALLVHIAYTSLGLAVIIHESKVLYWIVKIVGAAYLTYLGFQMIRNRKAAPSSEKKEHEHQKLTTKKAFIAGFFCNLLNPKASLFIMGLFTQVVQPGTSFANLALVALEIVLITFLWFALLSYILTHEAISHKFRAFQSHLNLVMGVLLIGFAFRILFS